ncbi:CHAP domain-containing protein [uncultured Dokdonia sp.]|uniref:CHAP domain-containing protein n=1 Tax=uncultured Dokdonia sp. TaxID=575653 RepID=UPI002607F534|nr:CHAP domain-containing protein [uncultured Dokdonia sp.]
MNKKQLLILGLSLLILLVIGILMSKKVHLNPLYEVGQKIDSLDGVYVYYNGGVGNVNGRRVTKDGYNLGLKYQCVEFVKRYYYEELHHKMPDSYGHAKDFFNPRVKDASINKQRDLIQYTNTSISKPKIKDLIIYSGTLFNTYGHVAIISKVTENKVEIIQQNPGSFGTSRETYTLKKVDGKWHIDNQRILGWLRKP